MAAIFPRSRGASWLLMIVVNGVMAQKFLTASGKNLRPIPSYSEIEVPIWPAPWLFSGLWWQFLAEMQGFLAST
jgi:hypothetical protein